MCPIPSIHILLLPCEKVSHRSHCLQFCPEEVAGPLKSCELENLESLLKNFDDATLTPTMNIEVARKVNEARLLVCA